MLNNSLKEKYKKNVKDHYRILNILIKYKKYLTIIKYCNKIFTSFIFVVIGFNLLYTITNQSGIDSTLLQGVIFTTLVIAFFIGFFTTQTMIGWNFNKSLVKELNDIGINIKDIELYSCFKDVKLIYKPVTKSYKEIKKDHDEQLIKTINEFNTEAEETIDK